VHGRSQGTNPGRPTVAKKGAGGWLAVLIFAGLAFAFAGGLKLFGVSGRWPYVISVPLVGAVYWPLAWWALIWRDLRRSRWLPSGSRWRRLRKVPWMVILLGWLMPFVAAFIIVLAAVDFGTTWPAAHGGGRPGTLLLQSGHCRKGHCTWSGQFRSDDGRIIRDSVLMRDGVPAGARVGDRVRARDTGNRGFVFAEYGSSAWRDDIPGFVLLSVYLLGWGACIFIQIRGWRAASARAQA
jgi:hypothetical protein